jgi:hypothetical protein
MKQIRSIAFCLTIMGVGLPASADIKSVHGAVCQPEQFSWADNVSYGSDGVRSVGGTHVICPLMRDRINSSTSMSSVVAEVAIATGGSINCTLSSQTEDGAAGSTVDTDSVSSSTSGETQMTFSVDSSNGNEGTYSLFCDMSNDSLIHHIYTNEDNGASD